METITSIRAMRTWADRARTNGQRIAFVPTMGFLHAGHLSLVAEARRHADQVVASIFVNPLQFGHNEDLDRYPRDIERDTKLLTDAGTDVLYLPLAAEMYPEGFQTSVNVEHVTQGLCGEKRPGHFRGVTTVVAKLFNAVHPHVAVFGEKDFQQLVALRRMVRDLDFDIEIIGGSIVREADGLAMSSRNAYLAPADRTAARCLSRALGVAEAAVQQGERSAAIVLDRVRTFIAGEPRARIDYVTLSDPESLRPVERIAGPTLLALAVWFGSTRLIDNTMLGRAAAWGEG
ncbi:MAG: pantoate--beta-alanine ligase [Deltaproteobacteria bacterium]|nr:pantoate--beta-alanine ligase [Deltaproteobacteria bacterium]MBI3387030.1 pantoate--beta-alanine ligase [Deltaproteobacteria bacterium]